MKPGSELITAGTRFLNLTSERLLYLDMNSNETETLKAARHVRCILLQHEKSNLVHDVYLHWDDISRTQDYVISGSFARRRVVEFVHVLLKVFEPAPIVCLVKFAGLWGRERRACCRTRIIT